MYLAKRSFIQINLVIDRFSLLGLVMVSINYILMLQVPQAKLKESQYQITPWQSDMNLMSSAQSPSRPLGVGFKFYCCDRRCVLLSLTNANVIFLLLLQNIGLELVPQPIYANGKSKTLSDPVNTSDLDILARHQSVLGGGTANNLEIDDFGVYSPIASR